MDLFISVAIDIIKTTGDMKDISLVFHIPPDWIESDIKRESTRRSLIDCFKEITQQNLILIVFGDECSECMAILQSGECRNPNCISKEVIPIKEE